MERGSQYSLVVLMGPSETSGNTDQLIRRNHVIYQGLEARTSV